MIVRQFDDFTTRRSFLIVVISPANFERMQQADPITLNPTYMGGILKQPLFPLSHHVCIAYETDESKVVEIAKRDNFELLEYLQRNYEFDASRGDGAHIVK